MVEKVQDEKTVDLSSVDTVKLVEELNLRDDSPSSDLSNIETAKLVEELDKREDKSEFIPDASLVFVPPKQARCPRPRGKNERM